MVFAVFSRSHRLAALAFVPFALFMGTAQPATAGKALIVCAAANPESFYPGASSSPVALDAANQIYDRLIGHEAGIVKLVPRLAQNWEVSNDGKTYLLHLRRGVKWHMNAGFTPTRDFNADDVLFSIERQWKEEHPYHKVGGANHAAFKEMGLPALLKSVEKLDDYTLRITLNRPEASFTATLAMDFGAIQSKEYADLLLKAGTPERLDQQPIGTGPFALAQFQKDAIAHFKAFPQYWGGPAATLVTDVVFAITPDASQRVAKLKSGDCDVMTTPNPADLPALRADSNLAVHEIPALNIAYLAYNTQKKPFDDVRTRRAFNLALNRKAIVEAAYPSGTGVAAISPLPPVIWGYNKSLRDEPYMPSAGKKLLAEAGVPEGFATELWVPAGERPARIASMMQADFAQIGVKVEIKTLDAAEFTTRTRNGEHTLALMDETGGNGDPDSILNTLLGCETGGGRNVARWCNDEFQRLMMQGKAGIAIGDRQSYYEQAQALFKKQAPWFTLAYQIQSVPVRKSVTGFKASPFGRLTFIGVDINK